VIPSDPPSISLFIFKIHSNFIHFSIVPSGKNTGTWFFIIKQAFSEAISLMDFSPVSDKYRDQVKPEIIKPNTYKNCVE